jgi:hypothetical protein
MMKLLVAAIVLAYALVSTGGAHAASIYKTEPAMVGAIWSDCSKLSPAPPPFSLACVHNKSGFKFDHGIMHMQAPLLAAIALLSYLIDQFQVKIPTRPRLALSQLFQPHQRKETHCKSLQMLHLVRFCNFARCIVLFA